jgi:hypothetical protein
LLSLQCSFQRSFQLGDSRRDAIVNDLLQSSAGIRQQLRGLAIAQRYLMLPPA